MRFALWNLRAALCATLTFASVAFGSVNVVEAADEMSFHAVKIGDAQQCGSECPLIISATGRITEDTPTRFLAFVEQNSGRNNLHAVVFLDSPGGRVLAAMEFGSLLRKVGAAAVVARVFPDGAGGTVLTNAQCFSACVYAFMGGRKRVIPASSQIGIHRMFALEDTIDRSGTVLVRHRRFDDGNMRAVLMSYSARMGVDPGLISAAEHVPSDQLRVLSRGEIRRWHLGVAKL